MNAHIETPCDSGKRYPLPSTHWRAHVEQIATLYDLTPAELLNAENKTRRVSQPRQHLMALLRADLNARGEPLRSYPKIAAILGMQDHTSIIWGVRAHARRVAEGKVP